MVIKSLHENTVLVTDHPGKLCESECLQTNTTLEFCIFTQDEYFAELDHVLGQCCWQSFLMLGLFLEISEDFLALCFVIWQKTIAYLIINSDIFNMQQADRRQCLMQLSVLRSHFILYFFSF